MRRYLPYIVIGVILTLIVLVANARLDQDRTFNPPPAPSSACKTWNSKHSIDTTTLRSACHNPTTIGTVLVCEKDERGALTCKETS